MYERSTEPLRYSEANWYNYISFCGDRALKSLEALGMPTQQQQQQQQLSSDTVSTTQLVNVARDVFERAVEAVGIDFSAQEIWAKYIDFEIANGDFQKVIRLFTKALSIPMNGLEGVWNKYRIFVQGRPLEDVLTSDELTAHRAKAAAVSASAGSDAAKRLEVETINAVIDKHELIYKKTLAQIEKRASYEKLALSRSYFHVMPVSPSLLSNWRSYLRWEEREEEKEEEESRQQQQQQCQKCGCLSRTRQLYERCLIACCAYQEFWFMYVDYLQRHGDTDAVTRVFERASSVYFKNTPSFFIKYALFEEANGRLDSSDGIYNALLARAPGLVEGVLKYAAFLRRRGCCVAKRKEVLERGAAAVPSERPRQKALLMLHLAKLFKQTGQTDLARTTYAEVTRTCDSVVEVWLCAIDFEVGEIRLCSSETDKVRGETRINALFHNALIDSCRLSVADKKRLWISWTEVSADWGFSIKTISAIEADYAVVLNGSYPDWTHSDSLVSLDPDTAQGPSDDEDVDEVEVDNEGDNSKEGNDSLISQPPAKAQKMSDDKINK